MKAISNDKNDYKFLLILNVIVNFLLMKKINMLNIYSSLPFVYLGLASYLQIPDSSGVLWFGRLVLSCSVHQLSTCLDVFDVKGKNQKEAEMNDISKCQSSLLIFLDKFSVEVQSKVSIPSSAGREKCIPLEIRYTQQYCEERELL